MFVMISVILIVLLMKVPWYPGTDLTVFSYSDPTLLLVYFILYMTASICFCFLISVLFSKGNSLHVIIVADVHSCVLLLCLSSLT
jgi:ATP-binding cassette subfamily A (ABC1) protein 3